MFYRVFVDGKPCGGVTDNVLNCCVAVMFLEEVLEKFVPIEVRNVEPPECFKPKEGGSSD